MVTKVLSELTYVSRFFEKLVAGLFIQNVHRIHVRLPFLVMAMC